MNIQRSTPITIARYGRPRNKTQDFEELSSIRPTESSQSFSPNLGSPSPPETPNLSHCVSCIGKYLLLEPLEGDHSFRAVHLHSEEELVCKVTTFLPTTLTLSSESISRRYRRGRGAATDFRRWLQVIKQTQQKPRILK